VNRLAANRYPEARCLSSWQSTETDLVFQCELAAGHDGDHRAVPIGGGLPGRVAWRFAWSDAEEVSRG
jgi:hypothetical protein